jgi:aminoglycoside 3'-phosphotransferase-1
MTRSKKMPPAVLAAMPASMRAAVAAYQWARDGVGESDAAVYRLQGRDGAPALFLKHGTGAAAADIADEMARLRWLARYLPVPAVLQFARAADPDQAWLLMTAIPGTTASAVLEANPALGPAVADALAAFLRRLHALPVSDCPFDAGHAVRLAQARQRIDAGLVDAGDFDAGREGWTAQQVWLALQEYLPLTPDLVVTHGDFSLDNILMH